MRAVRFHRYGGIDVLDVEEVALRPLGAGDVLVRVRAAGINPGEAKIRTGELHDTFPATFPSGQGSDLAGTVAEAGPQATRWRPGDEVLGWSWERSSHAEWVVVPETQLVAKPAALAWQRAGALYVAGATAWAAVNAIDPQPADRVLLAGASGGVGTIALQLLRLRGAAVTAIASPRHQEWIEEKGAVFSAYGADLADHLAHLDERRRPDALIDLHGSYVELAISLGVPPQRQDRPPCVTVHFDLAVEALRIYWGRAAGRCRTRYEAPRRASTNVRRHLWLYGRRQSLIGDRRCSGPNARRRTGSHRGASPKNRVVSVASIDEVPVRESVTRFPGGCVCSQRSGTEAQNAAASSNRSPVVAHLSPLISLRSRW